MSPAWLARRERIRLLIDARAYFPRRRFLLRWPLKLILALAFPRFGVLYFHRMNKRLKLRGWKGPAYLCYLANYYLNNVDISPFADIGAGVEFPHPLAVVIGGRSVLGPRTVVFSCVTLGTNSARAADTGYPTVGSDCYIGAGAKLIGPIRVGHRCVIGANSVVIRDVENGVSSAGVPARPLSVSALWSQAAR